MDFYSEFGRLVRSARDARGLTQDELAVRMGVSRAAIASIETGRQKVSLDLLPRFARFLGVEPFELLPPSAPPASPGELISELTPRERELVNRVWKAGTRRHRRLVSSGSR
jgi:transcriptional regulator with XRE-family HTH domain